MPVGSVAVHSARDRTQLSRAHLPRIYESTRSGRHHIRQRVPRRNAQRSRGRENRLFAVSGRHDGGACHWRCNGRGKTPRLHRLAVRVLFSVGAPLGRRLQGHGDHQLLRLLWDRQRFWLLGTVLVACSESAQSVPCSQALAAWIWTAARRREPCPLRARDQRGGGEPIFEITQQRTSGRHPQARMGRADQGHR